MTIIRCSIASFLSRHRMIALSSFFCTCAVYKKIASGVIFIKDNNINNGIWDLFFFPQKFIFPVYCCYIFKNVSNAFYLIYIYYYNSNLIRSAGSRQVDRHGSPDQTRRGASSLIK